MNECFPKVVGALPVRMKDVVLKLGHPPPPETLQTLLRQSLPTSAHKRSRVHRNTAPTRVLREINLHVYVCAQLPSRCSHLEGGGFASQRCHTPLRSYASICRFVREKEEGWGGVKSPQSNIHNFSSAESSSDDGES